MPRRPSRFADWKGVGSYGTIGLEMVLSVLFGGLMGHWLDSKFATDPYIMLFGFGLGVAAAVRALLRAMREMQRETARDGFKESRTDRPARFALDQREAEADSIDAVTLPSGEGKRVPERRSPRLESSEGKPDERDTSE